MRPDVRLPARLAAKIFAVAPGPGPSVSKPPSRDDGRGHTDSTLRTVIHTKHTCRCVSVPAPGWASLNRACRRQRFSARPRKIGVAKRDVPRKTPITLKGEAAALLTSGKVGSLGLILDDKDVVLLLKAAVEQEVSVSAFAKRHGLERTNLNNMLNGKRPVTSSLVKAMGLQRVCAPQKTIDN